MNMKVISAVCVALLSASAAFAVEVAALPPPKFADTEASTNFPFAVAAVPSHRLVFSLEFQSSASNNVEVAIGRDADGDGYLSLDETALAVGFDCGDWFVRSAAADSVTYSDATVSGLFRRTYEVQSRHVDPAWNLARVTRRGFGVLNETVSVEMRQTGFGITLQ